MLILVAGITGMVGRHCAEVALAKGHAVRGLGRNPHLLDETIHSRLEHFEQSTGIYDIAALDRAVAGVDAVICAYTFKPEVVIEGQLLLLRAAERAGIKIFHAGSWNYDWTLGTLGQHEAYDPYICFAAHVRLSSSIKPIYMFTGCIAEWVFNGKFGSNWDPTNKIVSYFGDGSKDFIYITAHDLAAYAVEAVCSPNADQGGYIRVESFRLTPSEVAGEINAARGGDFGARTKCFGTLEDVKSLLADARNTTPMTDFTDYIGYSYVVHMTEGTWDFAASDVQRFENVKQTSLREWFQAHPEV